MHIWKLNEKQVIVTLRWLIEGQLGKMEAHLYKSYRGWREKKFQKKAQGTKGSKEDNTINSRYSSRGLAMKLNAKLIMTNELNTTITIHERIGWRRWITLNESNNHRQLEIHPRAYINQPSQGLKTHLTHKTNTITSMAFHWIPHPPGVLKINVHGTSSRSSSVYGLRTGIGAVYHDSDGALKHLTIGVIPQLSAFGNQMWGIYITLRRAYKLGYRDVNNETDNLEAFLVIKNYHIGAPSGVYHIASQINRYGIA